MGSGTYFAVGFGCPALPPLVDDRQLFKIFEKHGIQTSCEGASSYAVLPLLSTLERCRNQEIPSGVMPIEDLADAIKKQVGTEGLDQATKTWRAVQAAAAALDVPINLPDGCLLWLCDYD